MLLSEQLNKAFKELGFARIPEIFDHEAEDASRESIPYLEFLNKLLWEEIRFQNERAVKINTKLSKLPFHKTMDEFDFEFQPGIDERRIKELMTLKFMEEKENVVILGPPGVGKSHIAVALAMEALKHRYTAYFTTAYDLIQTIKVCSLEGRMHRKVKTYLKPDLLIIDEMGYISMDDETSHYFFQIISERYEKGPIIITSNKSYGQWDEIFGGTVVATAILDRLLHHSTTINIKGESYRIKEKKKAGFFHGDPASANR